MLLSAIPTTAGQEFVVDDWDNKITQNDLGFNYFAGNTGATETVEGTTTIGVSGESNGSTGGSLDLSFDFTGQNPEVFAGYFASLFGLTDTLISLDGSGVQPAAPTALPGYYVDTLNLFDDFVPLVFRSVEVLQLDLRMESAQDLVLKIELQDENGFDVFTRRTLTNTGSVWQNVSLSLPNDFTDSVQGAGDPSAFDWRGLSTFSIIVERMNVGAGSTNPDSGRFLIDNLVLVDVDGEYPDLSQIEDIGGNLDPEFADEFLDLVRGTSSQFFLDFASTDPRTGGIIQDRSTFADLMTVGGVGFQLSSYVISAERAYIDRDNAAQRVADVLRTLNDQPQGPDRVGTIGHEGFFYHFLGINGLRKQNFDFTDTPGNEALNTVELSTIDTALALAGVVTAGQYFDGGSALETEIRTLSDQIYERVDWNFMLNTAPGDKQNQFFLGWKPNEPNEGPAFEVPDTAGEGYYSGRVGDPATVDFYTDEGLLIALLAMGSPEPSHRVGREVWDAMIRDDEGGSFVKTFPGSLFTYQFAATWLDTQALGTDNHPTRPTNFFDNTTDAIRTTVNYATDNPLGRTTLNMDRWGLSATEGPFDTYFAEASPDAAIHFDGNEPMGEAIGKSTAG